MKRTLVLLGCGGLALMAVSAFMFSNPRIEAAISGTVKSPPEPVDYYGGFEVQIVVHGRPLNEYAARGRSYVEAIAGAEYEVRVHNPLPYRVAVALSVDGLNTIDARRTSAWNASKWVIQPYGTINISGWQMSSARARHFYFTSERDSYGAKLGQTSNLGVVSAVFFREMHRYPYPVPVTPGNPPRPRPLYKEDGRAESEAPESSSGSSARSESRDADANVQKNSAGDRRGQIAPQPADEYAATGIGRSVHNDVRWVDMQLDSRPTAELTIRYEYYPALVRLGILPRRYERPDSLRRREGARGFEDRRFSPEP